MIGKRNMEIALYHQGLHTFQSLEIKCRIAIITKMSTQEGISRLLRSTLKVKKTNQELNG